MIVLVTFAVDPETARVDPTPFVVTPPPPHRPWVYIDEPEVIAQFSQMSDRPASRLSGPTMAGNSQSGCRRLMLGTMAATPAGARSSIRAKEFLRQRGPFSLGSR